MCLVRVSVSASLCVAWLNSDGRISPIPLFSLHSNVQAFHTKARGTMTTRTVRGCMWVVCRTSCPKATS